MAMCRVTQFLYAFYRKSFETSCEAFLDPIFEMCLQTLESK